MDYSLFFQHLKHYLLNHCSSCNGFEIAIINAKSFIFDYNKHRNYVLLRKHEN